MKQKKTLGEMNHAELHRILLTAKAKLESGRALDCLITLESLLGLPPNREQQGLCFNHYDNTTPPDSAA